MNNIVQRCLTFLRKLNDQTLTGCKFNIQDTCYNTFSIFKLICAASASKSATVTGQKFFFKKLRIYILKLNEIKMFSKRVLPRTDFGLAETIAA
jgi:hypothetical protein